MNVFSESGLRKGVFSRNCGAIVDCMIGALGMMVISVLVTNLSIPQMNDYFGLYECDRVKVASCPWLDSIVEIEESKSFELDEKNFSNVTPNLARHTPSSVRVSGDIQVSLTGYVSKPHLPPPKHNPFFL